VVEATACEASNVALHEIHVVVDKEAVEAVAKEVVASALREICHEEAMVTLSRWRARPPCSTCTSDAAEEDHMAEVVAVALAWGLQKEEEEEVGEEAHYAGPKAPPDPSLWQMHMTQSRIVAREKGMSLGRGGRARFLGARGRGDRCAGGKAGHARGKGPLGGRYIYQVDSPGG
jgi:hypothetical protein